MKHSLISFMHFLEKYRNWTMLRVIFRLGHSCHINYDDHRRGLLDVQQCHHSGPQRGCRILKNIIQTVWIWCHMTRAVFSTSLEESATRSWGSAVWSAPAAEDFLRTKGWLSSIGKRATLAVWRICMRDYSSVFTRCVSKVDCREMIGSECSHSIQTKCLHWLAFGLLHSSVSPQ